MVLPIDYTAVFQRQFPHLRKRILHVLDAGEPVRQRKPQSVAINLVDAVDKHHQFAVYFVYPHVNAGQSDYRLVN